MIDELENEYVLLFYKKNNIVGATNCVGTKTTVAALGDILANSDGEYLPNRGKYDKVGWIKNTNINDILNNAIIESKKNKNKGDSNDNN